MEHDPRTGSQTWTFFDGEGVSRKHAEVALGRPPFPMKATRLHCRQDDLGQGLVAASRFEVLAVIFRMLSPLMTRRCALWTSRSRTASAMVGSAITSCQ